jgi:hypothetical protein
MILLALLRLFYPGGGQQLVNQSTTQCQLPGELLLLGILASLPVGAPVQQQAERADAAASIMRS